ncbi:M20/M25/M40 family metallo-hydrolase [Geothrix sp. PMB-07]|uniref:M20/M25/M40 family metallo-hydrolase n=1 Tax=Geothrix sp. PMB-07 TaxID=3068640 RepID=UPI002740EE08|nr:M20/M25/M40 family metallo-hydrolase [Geothrix sp. PMB-07]WLT31636.1 M20/M25/M40 family metallo-hydrolase [Geothrix sp. PMB-07]
MRRPAGFLLAGLLALGLGAQGAPPDLLVREIKTNSRLMPNLEALCDGIGPRLTGSANLERAEAWAMDTLRASGAENVHAEAYVLGRPWHRGKAWARLSRLGAQKLDRPLDIAQWGWTEGTRGVVRGTVVRMEAPTVATLEAQAPALAGKVVLVDVRPRATETERKDMKAYRARLRRAWRAARTALVLVPSEKESGLLDMAGGPDLPYSSAAAFIAEGQARLLKRLLARGAKPEIEAFLGGGFGMEPVQAHNVVGELRGTEHPEEVVILGAHLDSWDLATGAADNGAGVVAFLEVLRAMKASGLPLRRTLRVVLFSGEEQGLLGSRAYLAAHAEETEKIQAVLVMDSGSGRISAMADGEVDAWAEALQAALKPAEALGAQDVVYARPRGSDHDTFRRAGIPAFAPRQESREYDTHVQHTRIDEVDRVSGEDLEQATQVMAILAWGLLNGPRLPHVPRDPS